MAGKALVARVFTTWPMKAIFLFLQQALSCIIDDELVQRFNDDGDLLAH
jgi:hypothetical protein